MAKIKKIKAEKEIPISKDKNKAKKSKGFIKDKKIQKRNKYYWLSINEEE